MVSDLPQATKMQGIWTWRPTLVAKSSLEMVLGPAPGDSSSRSRSGLPPRQTALLSAWYLGRAVNKSLRLSL